MGLEGLSVAEERDAVAKGLYQKLSGVADEFGELKLRVVNDMRRLFETGLGFAARWGGFFPLMGPGPGMYVFAGGHVEVDDGGHYHQVWSGLSTGGLTGAVAIPRTLGALKTSSHKSDPETTQYEIPFPTGWGCVLFGLRGGNTWFQVEGHSILNLYGHLWEDYQEHVKSGFRQVGVQGLRSDNSEKKDTQIKTGKIKSD